MTTHEEVVEQLRHRIRMQRRQTEAARQREIQRQAAIYYRAYLRQYAGLRRQNLDPDLAMDEGL